MTVTSEGRFSVNGSSYGYYYTKSSDSSWLNAPPTVYTLRDCTPTELNYFVEEGNPCRELKK